LYSLLAPPVKRYCFVWLAIWNTILYLIVLVRICKDCHMGCHKVHVIGLWICLIHLYFISGVIFFSFDSPSSYSGGAQIVTPKKCLIKQFLLEIRGLKYPSFFHFSISLFIFLFLSLDFSNPFSHKRPLLSFSSHSLYHHRSKLHCRPTTLRQHTFLLSSPASPPLAPLPPHHPTHAAHAQPHHRSHGTFTSILADTSELHLVVAALPTHTKAKRVPACTLTEEAGRSYLFQLQHRWAACPNGFSRAPREEHLAFELFGG